ncbi:MAG: hypothetical protein VXW00_13195 [Candidatus Latescibacterota bacterium]|nr:hypothetical protein [Candidatus Latescibacterota bacterium]
MLEPAAQFLLGMALAIGFYRWTSTGRARGHQGLMHAFTEARLHHVVVGWVVGFASMPLLGAWLERGVLLAALFLVGWYAMTFGALVDWRVIRLMNRQMLRSEGGQLAALLFVMVLVWYATERTAALDWRLFIGLGGVMAMSLPQAQVERRPMRMRNSAQLIPSVAIGVGIILLGISGLELRQEVAIVFFLPFSNPIMLEGMLGRVIGSLALGAVVGLLVDMVTRGAKRAYFGYLVGGGILLGVGSGTNVAVEPLWIGAIAGIWIINTTLNRVAVLQLAEGGSAIVRISLLGIVGVLAGTQIAEGQFVGRLFALSLALFLCLPAIRYVGQRMAGQAGRQMVYWRSLFNQGDLGLVATLALSLSAGPSAATSVGGAWLLCQLLYTLSGNGLAALLESFSNRVTPSAEA